MLNAKLIITKNKGIVLLSTLIIFNSYLCNSVQVFVSYCVNIVV